VTEPAFARDRAAPGGGRRRALHVGLGVGLVAAVAVAAVLALRRKDDRPAPEPGQVSAEKLRAALAEADRLDPGWRFADLERARAPVPEGDNAAPQVLKAARLIPERWSTFEIDRLRGRLRSRKAEDRAKAEGDLTSLEPALVEARKLATLTRGRFAVAWDEKDPLATPLPHVHMVERVASLLALDAERTTDPRAALASARAALNAGRSLGDEPTLEAQAVRAFTHYRAVEGLEMALNQGGVPEAELAAVQGLLEDEAAQPLLLTAARADRAGLHSLMLTLQTGGLGPHELASAGEAAGPGSRTAAARAVLSQPELADESSLRYAHAWLLDYTTRFVEVVKQPYPEQPAQVAALEAAATAVPPAARLFLPTLPLRETVATFQQGQALLRSAAAALAVERFRQKQRRWPGGLAELVPEFLRAVPDDPFDGKPLRFARAGEGVVVYSVGQDGKDDGGRPNTLNTYQPGTDVGFRLGGAAGRSPLPPPLP
jgi:hypothetical protein